MNTPHLLRLQDFDFTLPSELIAQEPARPRDHARLLVLRRSTSHQSEKTNRPPKNATIEHKYFYDISDYLQAGDVLVINDSKVIKARLHGTKPTGGVVEIFLLTPLDKQYSDKQRWHCLVKGSVKPGMNIQINNTVHNTVQATMVQPVEEMWEVNFNTADITRFGEVPLPPYIKSPIKHSTAAQTMENDYQTVYAKTDGSVAAPTAGLHFTQDLLRTLRDKGVIIAHVTLHVGLGTFAPVKHNDITKHVMHAEYGELPAETAQAIATAKSAGRKIVAVGTTSARTLEAFAPTMLTDQSLFKSQSESQSGWINIFITPGYRFKIVDALITNFHLPKTTLLMLVSALAGKANIDRAYQEAIRQKYRFYSFGDAMLIL